MTVVTEQEQVIQELRQADKLLLTTHENPDGDALGSLLAMHRILEQLGKDSLMYMSPDEFPLPWEYRGFSFEGLVGAPPADVAERTIVFLDCGNIDRMPVDFLQADGLHILNIDHHHDNTRFGTVNLVCSGRLEHGRDDLAPLEGARRRDHTGHRGRALRRSRDRHRPLHVREHLGRRAPHGRRADRGGRAAAPGLQAAVGGPSVPPPAAPAARARKRRSATTTAR